MHRQRPFDIVCSSGTTVSSARPEMRLRKKRASLRQGTDRGRGYRAARHVLQAAQTVRPEGHPRLCRRIMCYRTLSVMQKRRRLYHQAGFRQSRSTRAVELASLFLLLGGSPALVCVPAWGPPFITLAWMLWWLDVAIAVTTCFYLPFVIIHLHKTDLSKMTAAWLLPVVSTIVAAATRITLLVSYVLWGTGFPIAMVILIMYFHRLTVYQLPPQAVIVSVFLSLGPLGQGSFALMELANKFLTSTNTPRPDTGAFFYNFGLYAALIIWGYGLLWMFFAVASITRSRFLFNMGWWGFTFPLGVYSVLGTVFSLIVVALWLVVSCLTLYQASRGSIFSAPCVAQYREKMQQDFSERTSKD
ncbi:hypothetical protein ANO11243_018150 [Dothideomycetidae sp. 11243]|nr:hypothetical protein ANO11243_018150 [fungal sp. No.11243]